MHYETMLSDLGKPLSSSPPALCCSLDTLFRHWQALGCCRNECRTGFRCHRCWNEGKISFKTAIEFDFFAFNNLNELIYRHNWIKMYLTSKACNFERHFLTQSIQNLFPTVPSCRQLWLLLRRSRQSYGAIVLFFFLFFFYRTLAFRGPQLVERGRLRPWKLGPVGNLGCWVRIWHLFWPSRLLRSRPCSLENSNCTNSLQNQHLGVIWAAESKSGICFGLRGQWGHGLVALKIQTAQTVFKISTWG